MIKFLRSPWLLLLLWPLLLRAEPAFYQVEKGAQTLWLLGSVHAGHTSLYPLPKAIDEAWQQSRQLVVEVNLNQITPGDLAEMARLTRLPDGQQLADVLPAALYAKTQTAAARLGVPIAQLAPLQPWYAALALSQAAIGQSGFDPALGVDSHFLAQATDAKRPIKGLEGFTEQLGYLASVSAHQNAMLESTLDELDDFKQSFTEVLNAWQAGDETHLSELLKEEMGPQELQEWLEQKLLAERNTRWLTQLPGLESGSFIVVGSLHLYGPKGLLAGLAERGYRIERLSPPATTPG